MTHSSVVLGSSFTVSLKAPSALLRSRNRISYGSSVTRGSGEGTARFVFRFLKPGGGGVLPSLKPQQTKGEGFGSSCKRTVGVRVLGDERKGSPWGQSG